MIIRNAQPDDFEHITQIHASMGMDYALPDLNSPLFFVRKVADDGTGVVAACFLRISAECYLFLEPNMHPRDKVDVMQALQPEVLRAAWANGVDSVEARIPTDIERRFQKRLRCLGWTPNRDGWHPWTVQTYA